MNVGLGVNNLGISSQRISDTSDLAYINFDRLEFPPNLKSLENFSQLLHVKNLLHWGPCYSNSSVPISGVFEFNLQNGSGETVFAASSGLEGFVDTECKLRTEYGIGALQHHANDIINYISYCYKDVPEFNALVKNLEIIQGRGLLPQQLYMAIIEQTSEFCKSFQEQIAGKDQSAWLRNAATYYLYPKNYNLSGRRVANNLAATDLPFFAAASLQDFQLIKRTHPLDMVWFSGITKKGGPLPDGRFGWSPFAVSDYLALEPEFGTLTDYKRVQKELSQQGIKIMGDFIFNHTARDAKWLQQDPTLYIHKVAEPGQEPPPGYFLHSFGGKNYFIACGRYRDDRRPDKIGIFEDTAQLDFYNPRTQELIIETALKMIDLFGYQAARLDMAYCFTKECYSLLWQNETDHDISKADEFLLKLITAIKKAHPTFGILAEAHRGWDILSMCGCNAILGKNHIPGAKDKKHDKEASIAHGRHHGTYDALINQDSNALWSSVHRLSSLCNTVGAADMGTFSLNHDEPAVQRALAEKGKDPMRWWGVEFFNYFLPGCKLFCAGQEVATDYHDDFVRDYPDLAIEEPDKKALPFAADYKIAWDKNLAELQYFEMLKALRDRIIASQATKIIGVPSSYAQLGRQAIYQLADPNNHQTPLWSIVYNCNGHDWNNVVLKSDQEAEFTISVPAGAAVLVDHKNKKLFSSASIQDSLLSI